MMGKGAGNILPGGKGALGGRLFLQLREHKLVGNAGVYVFGNLLQKALGFLLIPVYVHFLTLEDYGITGLAAAVGNVLTLTLGLGLSGSIARYYFDFRDEPNRLKRFITTNFLFLALVGGTITALLFAHGEGLWATVTSGQVAFSPYIRVVLVSCYAQLLLQIPLSLYRTQQKARSFMAAQLGNFSLTLAATILFVVVWRMGATGQLLGTMVGSVVSAAVLTAILLRNWLDFHVSWRDLALSLAYGLPLVPHNLSGWAMSFMDRLLLEPRVPLAEVGLYNLGYQIGLGMAVLVTSINMAWSPYYYNLMKTSGDPRPRIRQVVGLYVALVGGLCMVGVLFGRELLQWVAPEQYQAAAGYVPLILLSYLLNGYYYFASMPLFYLKKTHLIPLITGSAAVLNIALNLWWIPLWGAMGSAWATLVSYAFSLAVAYLLGRRWQRVGYPLKQLGVANGLIFLGTLVGTYGVPSQVIGQFAWKLLLLGAFVAVAGLWLVRPNWRLREQPTS